MERTAFMDLSTGESSFDSPEFVDFLSRTSQVLNEEPNLVPKAVGSLDLGLADDALTFQAGGEIDAIAKYWENADPLFVNLIEEAMPFLQYQLKK